MSDGNPDFTLLRVARLIGGAASQPVERGAILMRGGEIVAAGPEERVVPPEGAHVREVHYEDKTALPGLVDCHVHLTGFGDGRSGDELATLPDELLTLQAARNAAAHLRSGVTTVRDCGAKNQTTFMVRRAYEMGIAAGPRLSLAGRPLAIVGGHLGYFGIEATGEVECRAHVRQLVKEGADFIKVTATGGSTRTSFPTRPSFSLDELTAIVDEAHSFGKHTVAHCASTQGMVNALDAGIDTIVHGMFVEPDGSWLYRPELAERIARQGVFVNPTIHNGRGANAGAGATARRFGVVGRGAGGAGRIAPPRPGEAERVRRYAGRRRAAGLRFGLGMERVPDGRLSARDSDARRGRHVALGGYTVRDVGFGAFVLDGRGGRHVRAGQARGRAGRRRRPVAGRERIVERGGRLPGRRACERDGLRR